MGEQSGVWENRAECGRAGSVGEQRASVGEQSGVRERRECGRAGSAGEQRVRENRECGVRESRGEQEVQKSELTSIVHAE